MITPTANYETEKNLKTGAEPIWILKCPFVAGTLYLSDRAVTVTGWETSPTTLSWISSWGSIDEDISNQLSMPIVADFSCDIIIDPNAATDIHDLLWSESVETIDCELYLWFNGLDASTDPPIKRWVGNIIDFWKLNELVYQVSLVDQGVKLDKYPGRVLSLTDYPNASPDDIGKQMPIIYGDVDEVPALKLDVGRKTAITGDITASDTAFSLFDASGLTAGVSVILIEDEKVLITGLTGNAITACRRGYSGTGAVMPFIALAQTSRSWVGMAAAPNGDIYACVNAGDIYKQTGGAGDFETLSQGNRSWYYMAAAPNGDIYACVAAVDIYKQTGGAGAFNALSQASLSWRGMCAAPNGDIYAAVESGDIYKQTGGAGAFNALSQTSRSWVGMAAAPNGDIYACVNAGDIYKQTGGAGAFNALSQASRLWRGMCAAPNGDIYACEDTGDIYKQAGGAGDFLLLSQGPRRWYCMAANASGEIYAGVISGDIYKTAGNPAHLFGAEVEEYQTTSVYLFADHPVKTISTVYAMTRASIRKFIVTSSCDTYTGQSGDELTGYEGMAVISCNNADYLVTSISGNGYQDDGTGTYTGTPSALIERPDHIFKHFLYTYAAWPTADFSTDAASPFAADAYTFSVMINERKRLREWLAYMALQCRCWFRFANDKAYLLYRTDTISSDKTITASMIVMNADNTTTLQVQRTNLDEIINLINLCYDRDWTKDPGADAYQAIVTVENGASQTAYGEKEQPDTFLFDFITDATMAADLAAFYLARYKDRKKVVTFTAFLNNFDIEFADVITIAPLSSLVCEVRKVGISPGNTGTNDKIFFMAREY